MTELYSKYCNKCKEMRPQIISKISRARGVKLMCIVCGKSTDYCNVSSLKKFQREEKNEKSI